MSQHLEIQARTSDELTLDPSAVWRWRTEISEGQKGREKRDFFSSFDIILNSLK